MLKQIELILLIYGFICDLLEFPSLKSSNIFTAFPIQLDIRIK